MEGDSSGLFRAFAHQSFNVGQILGSAGSALVLDQVLFGEHRDRLIAKLGDQPTGPSLGEIHSIDGGQNVDP
jgi:hypothetical protein